MDIMIDAVVHTVCFVNFQKIEYNWTNGSIYDFLVEKSVLYEVQQRRVCTFTDLAAHDNEEKEGKHKFRVREI